MDDEITNVRFEIGRVISTGWSLFWSNIRSILPILLIVYLPLNIVLSFADFNDSIFSETIGMQPMQTILIQLITFLITIIATIAVAIIIESAIFGERITWLQALQHAIARWGAAVITFILAVAILIILTFLLIIPAIIWGVYYSFAIYVVALRGLLGKDALDYSKSIVKGQWWRVFGYHLVIGLLGMAVLFVISIPFIFAQGSRVISILSDTMLDIVSAIFMTMGLVFYLNCDYLKQKSDEQNVDMSSDSMPGGDEPEAPMT